MRIVLGLALFLAALVVVSYNDDLAMHRAAGPASGANSTVIAQNRPFLPSNR